MLDSRQLNVMSDYAEHARRPKRRNVHGVPGDLAAA